MSNPEKRDEIDPALFKPLTADDPGSQAVEPSPDDDEENPVVSDLAEEIDDEDDGSETPPDQGDVEPGSDAASDDRALGVGKPAD